MNEKVFPEDFSQLVTGDKDDPLLPHIIHAINNADKIDLAVSFIRISGFRKLKSALQDAAERGAKIRIITGDYLKVTEPTALVQLLN
ncbi:hypothetical protein LCGC14_2735780, partial [marine sediment metagenome]